jgi:glycosyltransferase involved in cell wall biosynthesis
MNVCVSVIIPLYNKAPYIARAIDSVLQQRYGDFELIIVDDGSTDEGPSLVRAYSDPRVKLVTQPNAGPGAARNRGIELAQGELLAFLDADDEWLPTFLEESLMLLRQHGHEVALISSCYYALPKGNSLAMDWRTRGLVDGVYQVDAAMNPELFVALLAYISPCTTLVRKAIVIKYGGYYAQERCLYGEDAHLWMKVLLNHAVAVDLTPRVMVHTEASALSGNLSASYPLEPFLAHPEEILQVCPQRLLGLLQRVLAIRAMQTAYVFAVWHQRREGQRLLKRFYHPCLLHKLQFYASYLLTRPIGPLCHRLWRRVAHHGVSMS